MKKKTSILLVASLGVSLSAAPAFAQDSEEDEENPLRFSAEDFLDEYNLFLGEGAQTNDEDEEELDIELKLDMDEEEEEDFIPFTKGPLDEGAASSLSLTPVGSTQSTFSPRPTNLTGDLEDVVLPSGETFSLGTFTPRYTGADISFTIGESDEPLNPNRGLQISLASQYSERNANVFGAVNNSYVNEALTSRVYDFGLDVGYANVFLGASVRGEESAFYDGISGYDVAISYRRPTWSTSVLFGEYRPQGNYITSSLNSPYLDTRFFALELGAAYNVAPWVRFVGSFRMFEDSDLFLTRGRVEIGRMFYLGTRVNF